MGRLGSNDINLRMAEKGRKKVQGPEKSKEGKAEAQGIAPGASTEVCGHCKELRRRNTRLQQANKSDQVENHQGGNSWKWR